MNLIADKWISVKRRDGTVHDIAPWEIGFSKNPAIEIVAPRPDFRGALYQFLIGLVQTAFAPADNDEWKELWDDPPLCEDLRQAFERFAEAFELINDDGPAFMQDFNLSEKARTTSINALLTTSPGGNTTKLNKDLFIKRTSAPGFCPSCTAMALFTLQTNGIAVGAGYRTGIRGGGPLTTLIRPEDHQAAIWQTIWLNILSRNERFDEEFSDPSERVFPWMGPTRESGNGEKTYPEQVSQLQLYWAMPQRIRIEQTSIKATCSICGDESTLYTTMATTNYGISYSSTWIHTLSPYRIQQESDGSSSVIAMKGRLGGFSYPDWLSLTLANRENESAAEVVKSFNQWKAFDIPEVIVPRVWCFGYDADNATIRSWHDQSMPIFILPTHKRPIFIGYVERIIQAANDTAWILRNQIKAAWFNRPKDAKGDMSSVQAAFWEKTETPFYTITDKLRSAVMTDDSPVPVLVEWRSVIIQVAEDLFDHFALQDTDEMKNMKRIADAAKSLSKILRSPKTKSIEALKEVI